MCDFCDEQIIKRGLVYKTNSFFVRFDANPVSAGHILIIPKRHIVSFSELNEIERLEIWEALNKAIYFLKTSQPKKPRDFNIGINEGKLAGRTVDHLHMHVIPRYEGDETNMVGFKNLFNI